ncbi:MAG: SH3 domain-containing protein [Anaerolineales bacterium]
MREIFNLRVFLAAVAVGLFLTCIMMLYIVIAQPALPRRDGPPGALTRIPAPTSTAYLFTPTAEFAAFTATPQPSATPAPGQISLGGYVQITGTGGDGLRLRAAPGLDAPLLFLGYDTEIFQITDGPVERDGRIWWALVSPYDSTRAGWAVQDYLTPFEAP